MIVVNLKSAITFRVALARGAGEAPNVLAWSTKTFRADRGPQTIPEPKEHASFDVHEIAIDSNSVPWFKLDPPQRISIVWSNVLSVQHEDASL